tara:strand:- start:3935 stop:4810 length:876 start_codon:yes stop_codon:yes gene_type:complete
MSICVLNNFKKENLFLEPYPHIIIRECLDWDIYRELESSIDVKRIKSMCSADGAGAHRYKRGKFKGDIERQNNLLSEFMEYHTSPDFVVKVLNIFDKQMNDLYHNFYKSFKKENVLLRGVRNPEGVNKKEVLHADCQVVIHDPLPSESTTRSVHIDCFKELYAGLLYIKNENDKSTGGDLELYSICEKPRKRSEKYKTIYCQSSVEYIPESLSKYNRDLYIGWENEKDRGPEEVNLIKSKVVEYYKNNFIMFLNTPKSIHGVSTRFGAELERVHINMISDRVGKKSNMFKV